MKREMLGVAALGAAGAVMQERVRGRTALVVATAAGTALLGALARTEPDLVLMLALGILTAALLVGI